MLHFRTRLESEFGRRGRRRGLLNLYLALAFAVATLAAAADGRFLARDQQPDFLALLPARPAGVEQTADMSLVVSVHGFAPSNELAQAGAEGNLSEFVFAPAIGDFFKSGQLPWTEAFFRRVRRDSDVVVHQAKTHWKRLRPIKADPVLNCGIKDTTFSYHLALLRNRIARTANTRLSRYASRDGNCRLRLVFG